MQFDDVNLQRLIDSAQKRISAALAALPSDDTEAVSINALVGLEHLTKAALWRRTPTLLVSLTPNSEKSLLLLATSPDLHHPKLKTIGLKVALDRVAGLMPKLPVAHEVLQHLSNVRNGVVHVGSAKSNAVTLSDTLTLVGVLLTDLGVERDAFFAGYLELADRLVDDHASAVSREVALKLINAKRRLEELKARHSAEAYDELVAMLESRAAEDVSMDSILLDLYSVPQRCPVCAFDGRLIGSVEVDVHHDVDVEPLGGGEYETIEYAINVLTFDPLSFGCNVCALSLINYPELQETDLPLTPQQVEEDDLFPTFDMEGWIQSYGYAVPDYR